MNPPSPPRPRTHLVERAMIANGMDLSAPSRPAAPPKPTPSQPPAAPPAPAMASPPVPPPASPVTAPPPVVPQPVLPVASSPVPPPAPPPRPPQASPSAQPARSSQPVSSPFVIPAPVLIAAGLVASPGGSARLRTTEEMNLVQQQVLQEVGEAPCERGRVVLVTSARPGEGKTFVALNLAAAMAANGQRAVVLVDADGRRGALSDALGASAAAGLRDLALSPAPAARLLLPTAVERLFFLTHGGASAGVPPSGTALAEAMTRLARSLPHHLLVLDTPPSLSSSNAHALAAHAGQVVMVVAAEGTRNEEVEAALDMMEACPRLQLLLNRMRVGGKGGFGAQAA